MGPIPGASQLVATLVGEKLQVPQAALTVRSSVERDEAKSWPGGPEALDYTHQEMAGGFKTFPGADGLSVDPSQLSSRNSWLG